MKTNLKNYLPLLILLFAVSFSYGQSRDNNLQDLIGVKGSGAENALIDRGYKHIKTQKSDYDIYANWWNSRHNKCVTVRVNNGRVKSIINSPSIDCNKNSNSSSYSSNKYNRYNENYSHNRYNNDNFNNSYHSRDSRGYNGHAEVHDLMKISAPLAYDKLKNRGFHLVKTTSGDSKTYKVWYNHETNQCIKTISINKHIHDVLKSTHCN